MVGTLPDPGVGELQNAVEDLVAYLCQSEALLITLPERAPGTIRRSDPPISYIIAEHNIRHLLAVALQDNDLRARIMVQFLQEAEKAWCHAPDKVVRIQLGGYKESWRSWPHIPIPATYRNLFPGYKVSFMLEADGESFVVNVTSRSQGAPQGKYICIPRSHHDKGKLGAWYNHHPGLHSGDTLLLEVLEPMRRYRLSILDS